MELKREIKVDLDMEIKEELLNSMENDITPESQSLVTSSGKDTPTEIVNIRSIKRNAKEETNAALEAQKVARLNFLLERSSIYSKFLSDKLESFKSKEPIQVTPVKKRRTRSNNKSSEKVDARQPKLLSGAVMKDYQIDGMEWLISLYENGLNGILADEMGLGKTIQTIAFLCYLIEQGIQGPYLIVVPLTTITNWMKEFERFAPTVKVLMFYGSKEDRKIIKMKDFKNGKAQHNVIITSYEIAIKDRTFLQRFPWKYLVVDEGHRLKNFDCKLSHELRKIGAANRLLLTGTPLHNDLSELWGLLNFILPDIFDDLSSFIDWFDFSDIKNNSDGAIFDEKQKSEIITKLHNILKPFLLRRLKTDVELSLPKKREYILNAYLTAEQKQLYEAVLNDALKQTLIDLDEMDKESIFKRGNIINEEQSIVIKNQNFNKNTFYNKTMQLRKVCNHPFIFNAPYDKETGEYIYDPKKILNYSGKMLLLDKLLKALISKGHRVLIFTQFTKMLDIIETYILEILKEEYCRIDGSVVQDSRQSQINEFNSDENIKVFIISTRAGGLGINLASADSVIFFDSDWNPQMDLQAQDRAHRIGQKRPVVVYRLITANTVEGKLIGKANSKRLLEKLVIHKDKFKGLRNEKAISIIDEEWKDLLFNKDYEQVIVKPGDELIPEKDLERILDRSDQAYAQAYQLLFENKLNSNSGAYQLYETKHKDNGFSLIDDTNVE